MSEPRIAVLFGGPSGEHEVSIASAHNVAAALLECGFPVIPAFWRREGDWHLGAEIRPRHDLAPDEQVQRALQSIDAALPVAPASAAVALSRVADGVFCTVHGDLGEDGAVQGLFQVLGLPLVGSPVLASALSMDKQRAKDLVRSRCTVEVLPALVLHETRWKLDPTGCLAQIRELGLPLVVKPAAGGSSVGLSRVDRIEDVAAAVDRSLDARGPEVLLESFAAGDELSCVVVGNEETGLETFPPILIRPRHGGLFDYEAKYTKGGAEELCPAPISEALRAAVEDSSLQVYRALGGRGFARIDFIASGDSLYFLEMNTLPGFTAESLVPRALAAKGVRRADFVRRLLDLAGISTETASKRARAAGQG